MRAGIAKKMRRVVVGVTAFLFVAAASVFADFPVSAHAEIQTNISEGKMTIKPIPQTPDELAAAVRAALNALKERRPVFHSEADFQLELFHEMTRGGIFSRVMMERHFAAIPRKRVDIVADGIALELKEKSGDYFGELEGEWFNLRGDRNFTPENLKSAQGDIRKLAKLIVGDPGVGIGFVVILTSRNFPDAERKLLDADFPDNCEIRMADAGVWSDIPKESGGVFRTRYFLVEIRES